MTVADKIKNALEKFGPMCDGCLVKVTKLSQRSAVNAECNFMMYGDELDREKEEKCPRCGRDNFVNYLN